MVRCPNCDYTFRNGSQCPGCGVDVVLFQKAKSASNKLYNKGLTQAQNNDLSGAILSLEQSVCFYKKNERARNLLGLIYYETGRIADALMQWIISSSLVKEENPAKAYIDSLQNNARVMEKFNDSVRMYNQALIYLTQRSEDLAVIQLKKAVDFNPKFIEAWNLLTLCYIEQNEFTKARSSIEKVRELDLNNQRAAEFGSLLGIGNVKKEAKTKKTNTNDKKTFRAQPSYKYPEKKNSILGRTEIISFFIGILCTTAVLMTLVMPAWVDAKSERIKELETKITELSNSNASSSKVTEEYQAIKSENEKLKAENEAYKNQEVLSQKLSQLAEVETLSKDGDDEGAALLLAGIGTEGLPEDAMLNYNSLKENVYPNAAKSFYNNARSQYMNKNYDEAQGNFENCLKFASGENFVDDGIYYLGKIAELKGDTEKAKTYFQRVMNEFPDSNQFKNAENAFGDLAQ